MLLLCTDVLLATLWSIIGMISALRQPAYTFSDWQTASDRIYREMLRLRSATCAASDRGTYLAFLKDLLASTGFILNLVDNACRYLQQSECPCCARDVLNRAVSLRLLLYWAKLELCFLPPGAHILRRRALAAMNSYISLCLSWTTFLEHYI